MHLIPLLVIWATIMEVLTFVTWGEWISESELDVFFDKHINNYHINTHASRKMFSSNFDENLPFIARRSFAVLTAWSIDDHGTIPRWSKWNKKLLAKYKELEDAGKGRKTLKDL